MTQHIYDAEQRRIKTIDALGRESRTVYRADGLVEQMIDADGNITAYEYDANKLLSRLVDPHGHIELYDYDARGDLVQFIDPLGNTSHMTYDAVRRPVSVTDAVGNTIEYVHDVRNNVIEQIDALGNSEHFEYDSNSNLVAYVDHNGNRYTHDYDTRDRLVRTVNPLVGETLYEYDDVGRIIRTVDANGHDNEMAYDALGRVITETDALGGTRQHAFNDLLRTSTFTDELGRTTTSVFDELLRLTTTIDALGNETHFEYDAVGNLTATIDALGRTTSFEYDSLNRMIREEDPSGATTDYEYDETGNLTRIVDALGAPQTMVYDAKHRLLQTTYVDGSVYSQTYDAVGNRISTTDGLGRTTNYNFDALNRVTSMTNPRGSVVSYVYDPNGNRTQVTDPNGNITSFVFDELNRVTEEVDPLRHSRLFAYDPVENLISRTDRNGRVTEFSYDPLDRRTAETWLNTGGGIAKQFSYGYDATSNLTSASDGNVSHTRAYDSIYRLIQAQDSALDGSDVTLDYLYDAVGNRTQVTDSAGVSVSSTYDVRNLVTSHQWQGGGISPARIDFAYDARGARTMATRFSDLAGVNRVGSSTRQFDTKGRLTSIIHQDAIDSILAQFDYDYDLADQLISEASAGEQVDYDYDLGGQLTSADAQIRADETYTYDASGNRNDSTNTIGTGNQLLTDATFDYGYDDEGNLIIKTERSTGIVTRFTYDHRNRLTFVETKDSTGSLISTAEYVYDVFDRRIVKRVDADGAGSASAVETHSVYDGANAWADLAAAGNFTARYFFGNQTDELLARWRPAEGTAWYLTDRLGSVTHILSSSGAVVSAITYDSFGGIVSETNIAVGDRFKFTGREYDSETGNYYYRARYYDPGTGRFLSTDSYGFAAGDANLYRYVGNSPTNATDPSGHLAIVTFIMGGMVGSAVGGLTGFLTGAWCEYWNQWSKLAVDDSCDCSCDSGPKSIDWDMVVQKGLEKVPLASAMGFVMGGSFALLSFVIPAPLLVPLGATVGFAMSIKAIADENEKIDKLWANRKEHPEALFSSMMCLFGDTAIGEVTGPLVASLANKGLTPNRVKKFEESLLRFLKDESGSLNLNIESWKWGDDDRMKTIAEGYGKAAEGKKAPGKSLSGVTRDELPVEVSDALDNLQMGQPPKKKSFGNRGKNRLPGNGPFEEYQVREPDGRIGDKRIIHDLSSDTYYYTDYIHAGKPKGCDATFRIIQDPTRR